jgi:kynurenine formamidase
VNDDIVTLYTQYSSQWDGFAHVGSHFDANGDGEGEVVYYNGHYPGPDAGDLASACIQGRGVMIDLHRRFGDARVDVDLATLRAIMDEQGAALEPGDILALHTGYAQLLLDMERAPRPEVIRNAGAALDASDPALLAWIASSGVAAIVADNFAVESFPPKDGGPGTPFLPLHELCLFKLGIPLGEIWYLTELARWLGEHGRTRFFLSAPPLNLPGYVGSPANPIATV